MLCSLIDIFCGIDVVMKMNYIRLRFWQIFAEDPNTLAGDYDAQMVKLYSSLTGK